MHDAWVAVRTIAPAVAFLLAGVPLAALLDRLGFFDALAVRLQRRWPDVPVLALWAVAAATTVVLNLDTTIVLLTPLYVRLARRAGVDPVPLALVPLLLAASASSVLPVSNLTTLVAQAQLGFGVGDVLAHLAVPSLAAVVVGWFAYRRRHPTVLRAPVVDAQHRDDAGAGIGPGLDAMPATVGPTPGDERALRVGGVLVVALLLGFTLGPLVGVPAWAVAVGADVVLVVVTRWVPWRSLPVATALGVAAIAALVAVAARSHHLADHLGTSQPLALAGVTLGAAAIANVVNNIPAALLAVEGATRSTDGQWAWLLGVNVGAVLLPVGALANVLWRRILRTESVDVPGRRYVALVWPVAVPSLVAATLAHAALAAVR